MPERKQLIGRTSPELRGLKKRDVLFWEGRTPKGLDRQVKLLEKSGMAEVLGVVAQLEPDTGLFYDDSVRLDARGVIQAGYTLQRKSPDGLERKISVLSNGNQLTVFQWDNDNPDRLPRFFRVGAIPVLQFQSNSVALIDHVIKAGILSSGYRDFAVAWLGQTDTNKSPNQLS